MSGSLTLAQIAARQPVLEVRCTKCDRRGRYRTATLVERYGAGFAGPDLRDRLSARPMKNVGRQWRSTKGRSGEGAALSGGILYLRFSKDNHSSPWRSRRCHRM